MKTFNRFRIYFILSGFALIVALAAIERSICEGNCQVVSPFLKAWFWPVTMLFGLFTVKLEQLPIAITAFFIVSAAYTLILLYTISILAEKVRK
jgi:hypothetical protein